DGSGYPAGLKGEEIPIGARILSAVDCLDALATDRQYRRGLPLHEAMAKVVGEAGKAFDPKVVELLQRRYVELERMAHEQPAKVQAKLSTDVKVERGLAPAAGFAESPAGEVKKPEPDRVSSRSVAAARRQSQAVFERASQSEFELPLDDTLAVLSTRLKQMLPHDAMAVYLKNGDTLTPGFVNGDNHRLFSSLRIPIGE